MLIAAGATAVVVAPTMNVQLKGRSLAADGQLAGTPSVLFDAVALILTEDGAAKLAHDSAAIQFVQDAFVHLKAIGCVPGAEQLLERAGVVRDAGVTGIDKAFLVAAADRFRDREPLVRTLA